MSWTPNLHPRYPKGHPMGGKFMKKGSPDWKRAIAQQQAAHARQTGAPAAPAPAPARAAAKAAKAAPAKAAKAAAPAKATKAGPARAAKAAGAASAKADPAAAQLAKLEKKVTDLQAKLGKATEARKNKGGKLQSAQEVKLRGELRSARNAVSAHKVAMGAQAYNTGTGAPAKSTVDPSLRSDFENTVRVRLRALGLDPDEVEASLGGFDSDTAIEKGADPLIFAAEAAAKYKKTNGVTTGKLDPNETWGYPVGKPSKQFTPGGWVVYDQESFVADYKERHRVATQAAMDKNGWEATPEDWAKMEAQDDEIARMILQDSIILQNGPHAIHVTKRVRGNTDARVIAEQFDTLATLDPPSKNMTIRIDTADRVAAQSSSGAAAGFAYLNGGSITLSDTGHGEPTKKAQSRNAVYAGSKGETHRVAHLMPMFDTTPTPAYFLAHEYGHSRDDRDLGIRDEHHNHASHAGHDHGSHAGHHGDKGEIEFPDGLSSYGRGDRYEAYAEAYAEWMLSKGKTKNAAARQYAAKYHWRAAA